MDPVIAIATELGNIVVELDEGAAPGTVANFLTFVDAGAYDGGSFHRTVTSDNQPDDEIRIAVIQGGEREDFGADAYPELPLERTNVTGLAHLDGTISMGRRTPLLVSCPKRPRRSRSINCSCGWLALPTCRTWFPCS